MPDEYPYSVNDLKYPTAHLAHFDDLNAIIALHGKPYLVLKKAVWYSLMGAALKKQIRLGTIYSDTRLSLSICLRSGSGKKNVISSIKDICKKIGIVVAEPKSLHPEQLVGKTIQKKGKSEKIIQNPGHLADDYLILDEALELLRANDPLIKTTRNYISTALDPIGRNDIEKRMVEFSRPDTLKYAPSITIALFFQPYPVNEQIVTAGLARRFATLYIKPEDENIEAVFKTRLYGDGKRESSLTAFCDFLTNLKNKNLDKITFAERAKERIFELQCELARQGNCHSDKGKNYTEIVGCTLQDYLVKMSYILACMEGSGTVEIRHVELAYVDLAEFFASGLQWIQEKIIGNMDYGDLWGGATSEDKLCLQWLYERGDSQTSISEYWDNVAENFAVSKEQARKIYYRHVQNGWVKGKQEGKHDSRVWLLIKPKIKGAQAGKGGLYTIKKPTEYEKITKGLAPP
jgi:hypothetical protein